MKETSGMNSPKPITFADWADSVDHDEERIRERLITLIDHLQQAYHSQGQAHGNIRPETIPWLEDNRIDLDAFRKEAVKSPDVQSPYTAPELGENNSPPAATILSDIYSLSAVFYYAVSGQPPLKAGVRRRCSKMEPLFQKSVTENTRAAITAGLSIDPNTRPKDLAAFKRILSEKPLPGDAASTVPATAGVATPRASPPPTAQPTPHPPPPPTAPVPVKRLPLNLTAGQVAIVPIGNVIPKLGEWEFDLGKNEALRVEVDRAKGEFLFTPMQSGEQQLELFFRHPDLPDQPAQPKSVAVTVNPDPDSLWQNKDPDPNLPYQKEHTASKELVTPAARILAASQRGRSHAHEGTFRDDDFLVRYDKTTGWHLLAAADGAGSAKFSRQGSLIACDKAIHHMEDWLTKETVPLDSAVEKFLETADRDKRHLQSPAYGWLGGAAIEALKAIKAEAEQRDPPASLRDFHTTLLLAAAKPTPEGWLLLTFSIGDGGIAAIYGQGEPISLCTPDSGDFSGQTVFLTVPGVLRSGEDVLKRIHVQILPDFSALFLMTDGITDPKFPTEASLKDKPTWEQFLQEINENVRIAKPGDGAETRLLSWLSFRSPGNHDDRTLVILLPIPPGTAESKENPPPGFLTRLFGAPKKKTS
jgi:hypothetical protein